MLDFTTFWTFMGPVAIVLSFCIGRTWEQLNGKRAE